MAKFPDPTHEYKAEPVGNAIDLSPSAPTTPVSTPVYTPMTPPVTDSANAMPPTLMTEADNTPITPGSMPTPPVEEAKSDPIPSKTSMRPSPFRNLVPLLLGGGVFIILALVAMQFIPKLFAPKASDVTLNYWGLWEPASVMQSVIADYEAKNPGVKIVYTMQSPKNYRARLQTAISGSGATNGPDIARIHNTWLPLLRKNLSAAPESIVPASELASYYPVVTKDLTAGGKTYALPLMVDGLALYYNEDILTKDGITPPSDWNGLRKAAFDLTVRNKVTGVIERSGIALGTTGNVTHWSDILGLLILQNSGTPGKPSEQAVQDAITFYTTFSALDKTWDATQPNDIYAFATGTVAMIIAPSWQSPAIAAINPDLKFKTVPAPTLPETKTAWATYWAEAVPASSKNQAAAWKFINYLSTPEVLQKLYASETQIRKIGEIYPRTDMASLLSTDPIAGAFVNQATNYTSWYLSNKTYDEAINDELIKYYEDAINGVAAGSPIQSVLTPLTAGVDQVLSKYPEVK